MSILLAEQALGLSNDGFGAVFWSAVTKKDSQSEPRKCYSCGKPGHFVRDCHKLKKLKKGQTDNSATADQQTASKPSLN